VSRKNATPAISYLRTSSAANVGPDKDSDKRQREAINAFAKSASFAIVGEFYDAAVSGSDEVQTRPGFAAMLERIKGNGVRTIIVETANRFARDLIVQETGYRMLRDQGIDIIAADSPNSFVDDGPTATLVRQVLGAVAQFDKAMTVAKLRGARERKKASGIGRYVGRKSHAEKRPTVVTEAKRLYRANPKTGERRSLRDIAAELDKLGFRNEFGRKYHSQSIARMVDGPMPNKEPSA